MNYKKLIIGGICTACIFATTLILMGEKSMATQKLNSREPHIAQIAGATAAGDMSGLTTALNAGLDDGLSQNDIKEILIQMYAYCGFPRSLNAINNYITVESDRKSRGISDTPGVAPTPLAPDANKEQIGRETREHLTGRPDGGAAYAMAVPAIDQYLKEHLFADIFARGVLTEQEREIATIAALATMTGTDAQLAAHIAMAKNIGLTDEQITGVLEIAHQPHDILFGMGQPNTAFEQYFSGPSYLNMLTTDQVGVANITFEPGVRNNWHIHHGGGQILLATQGRGYYQEWNKPARELKPGDVVNIPAGVKHWHGAAPDSWFTHIAIEVPGENKSNEWLEPVNDAEYSKLK